MQGKSGSTYKCYPQRLCQNTVYHTDALNMKHSFKTISTFPTKLNARLFISEQELQDTTINKIGKSHVIANVIGADIEERRFIIRGFLQIVTNCQFRILTFTFDRLQSMIEGFKQS